MFKMKKSLQSEKLYKTVLVLLLIAVQLLTTEGKLPYCSKSIEGNQTLYRKASGNDGILICLRTSGQYVWEFLDGSSTIGENFNPAKDCSDIVDNLPEAKDGFYWIEGNNENPSKAWCDTHTDGGGFLLIGMKESPVTWNVPFNENLVDPLGPPHWSTMFGDVNVQDFAIQISTTKNFKDTKAHWSYRLNTRRPLGNLFGVGSGGCTEVHSGIGNVSYIKDVLTEKVITTKFNCSIFGFNTNRNLGWGRMNHCFKKKCPDGYAFFKGVPFRLDSYGSFSYSASSGFSGITHDATAFVGCDADECCACFGPKGGRGHYCRKRCTAINNGTIITGKVYVWFWIRTRMPKRLWKRCMEFEMKTEAGKSETYYIDRMTDTAHKGTCSEQFHEAFLNEGTLVVKNKESLNNVPPLPGFLSYREDNEKLYVKKKNKWDAIGSENDTKNFVESEVTRLEQKLAQQKENQEALSAEIKNFVESEVTRLEQKLAKQKENQKASYDSNLSLIRRTKNTLGNLESNVKGRLNSIESEVPYIGRWPSGSYCILANGNCPSGFSRHHGYIKAMKLHSRSSEYIKQVYFGDSSLNLHGRWVLGDVFITACCK